MRILIAFSVAILFLLNACKKSNDQTPDPNTSRLKTYIEDFSGVGGTSDTFNIAYDSQNRISNVTSPNSGLGLFYTYNTETNLRMEIRDYSEVMISANIFLNNDHVIDSMVQINDTQDTMSQKYMYNWPGNRIPGIRPGGIRICIILKNNL